LNIVAVHFDRNRTHRRESRLGVKTARDIEEEEKQAFITKQFNFYQQKQKLFVFIFCFIFTSEKNILYFFCHYREENDIALAQQLQEKMKIQPNSIDQTTYRTHHHASDDQV
jgi:hypothetical protein